MEPLETQIRAVDYEHKAYIVGGGPSLRGFDWNKLNDKFVVAINRAYEVLPNAQILYFTDKDYWERHCQNMRKHGGHLVRGVLNPTRDATEKDIHYYHLTGSSGYETGKGRLRHGSNSTYAAINLLAAHLGFKTIYLLGIDMKWGQKGVRTTSHWHDGHKRIDPESGYLKMMNNYKSLVEPLSKAGVTVINGNPNSALKVFPRQQLTFED